MITIKLQVSERIHEKIMWFLSHFSADELRIVEPGEDHTMSQEELDIAYTEVVSEAAETISVEAFNDRLSKRVAKDGS